MVATVPPVYRASDGAPGHPMANKTTNTKNTKSKERRTWLYWMAADTEEPPTLTRPKFVERLQAEGVNITPQTLAYWEREGVIPRSVRRWQDGAPQSIYPLWMMPVVRTVRTMQAQGASLKDIRQAITTTPWQTAMDPPAPPPLTEAEFTARFTDYVKASEQLGRQIAELARLRELAYGVRIVDVELRFRDATGLTGIHRLGSPFGWLGEYESAESDYYEVTE